MTQQQKYKFRMSAAWKSFRAFCKRKAGCFDFISRQPLTPSWNLHHLDLRDRHYTDISDAGRFLPLNKSTHEFVHWLYVLWSRDPEVLSRIGYVLERMRQCTFDGAWKHKEISKEVSMRCSEISRAEFDALLVLDNHYECNGCCFEEGTNNLVAFSMCLPERDRQMAFFKVVPDEAC